MTAPGSDQNPNTQDEEKSQRFIDPREWRLRLENALDFPATVREALKAVRAASTETLEANEDSRRTHDWLLKKKMEVIERELAKPHLTREDRDHLMAMVDELIERANEKDSENRHFLTGLTQERMRAIIATTGIAIGAAGAVAITAVAGTDGLKQVGQLLPQIAQRAVRK
ncbi:hypothetical protein NJC10_10130 [Micrococcus sp. M4NT]|uniref:hypothetical protein n=1 Tax=Micrococcus sp. M4NT TaxID=2957501 RepID=UPI0029AB2EB1|nr:hypothetical protein [Micrococcus sp. M4NT]MDX2342007.1 hypothetical protein [Micrococcus sp. M4NT]